VCDRDKLWASRGVYLPMRDVEPAPLRTSRRRLVYVVLSFAAVDLLWLIFIAHGVYRLLSE
jgi:hypothetical protein